MPKRMCGNKKRFGERLTRKVPRKIRMRSSKIKVKKLIEVASQSKNYFLIVAAVVIAACHT